MAAAEPMEVDIKEEIKSEPVDAVDLENRWVWAIRNVSQAFIKFFSCSRLVSSKISGMWEEKMLEILALASSHIFEISHSNSWGEWTWSRGWCGPISVSKTNLFFTLYNVSSGCVMEEGEPDWVKCYIVTLITDWLTDWQNVITESCDKFTDIFVLCTISTVVIVLNDCPWYFSVYCSYVNNFQKEYQMPWSWIQLLSSQLDRELLLSTDYFPRYWDKSVHFHFQDSQKEFLLGRIWKGLETIGLTSRGIM